MNQSHYAHLELGHVTVHNINKIGEHPIIKQHNNTEEPACGNKRHCI
ncbi:hypothetical protein SAMN04488244_12516 [Vibrio hangzhouensis]|uniref:Uncharacterized protein n=1 Tax=Vibrio hangzhouensis TaxID=462991 RepID=A0A1H6BS08_9VIBR|nr:hypothetical protein SAMN04488244_12516 [Vibrio hangzhouensis]